MGIFKNSELETLELPGLRHQTIGGHKQGVKSMEVWVQTMAPGAATPVHRHECEEVILVLSGSGTCTVGDETFSFGPDSTLVLESDTVHQIVNTSGEEMKLVAALGMAPVRVKTGDGEPLPVPWQAPDA
ncbi:cupin domain-containing protein [Marinobacter similis]|uniref:Cupin n=1 Tax=Marinobacter similis TaxID=1420916 RepID=W5YG41_9GAMM|nr:cupin domain-containing protein [Marinobacter similis]AHI28051.1 cupin [Marinobacter similis]